MAGTIELNSGALWSAPSWLFDWVLWAIAESVADIELAADLIGILDEDLGWLSLFELPTARRRRVEEAMLRAITPKAEAELPVELDRRDEVIAHVRALGDELRQYDRPEESCGPVLVRVGRAGLDDT